MEFTREFGTIQVIQATKPTIEEKNSDPQFGFEERGVVKLKESGDKTYLLSGDSKNNN